MKNKNKLLLLIVIGITLYGILGQSPDLLQPYAEKGLTSEHSLTSAYENRKSDIQVGGLGKVIHILADDTDGSQHQKFIIELSSGQSLLISHNIDLAPRLSALHIGDTVEFFGEYEWNPKGGVVHWTHHDPMGNHVGGWLKHNGVVYQ